MDQSYLQIFVSLQHQQETPWFLECLLPLHLHQVLWDWTWRKETFLEKEKKEDWHADAGNFMRCNFDPISITLFTCTFHNQLFIAFLVSWIIHSNSWLGSGWGPGSPGSPTSPSSESSDSIHSFIAVHQLRSPMRYATTDRRHFPLDHPPYMLGRASHVRFQKQIKPICSI